MQHVGRGQYRRGWLAACLTPATIESHGGVVARCCFLKETHCKLWQYMDCTCVCIPVLFIDFMKQLFIRPVFFCFLLWFVCFVVCLHCLEPVLPSLQCALPLISLTSSSPTPRHTPVLLYSKGQFRHLPYILLRQGLGFMGNTCTVGY